MKDDETTRGIAAVRTLRAWSNPFWASNEAQLAAQLGGVPPADVDDISRRRRLLGLDRAAGGRVIHGLEGYEAAVAAGEAAVRRRLGMPLVSSAAAGAAAGGGRRLAQDDGDSGDGYYDGGDGANYDGGDGSSYYDSGDGSDGDAGGDDSGDGDDGGDSEGGDGGDDGNDDGGESDDSGGGGSSDDGLGGGGGPRQSQSRLFHMFYRYADNSTAITDSMVAFVRPRFLLSRERWLLLLLIPWWPSCAPCFLLSSLAVTRTLTLVCLDSGPLHFRVTRASSHDCLQACLLRMQALNEVENLIVALPAYQQICREQEPGICDHPFGIPTAIYAQSAVLDVAVDGDVPESDPSDTRYVVTDTCAATSSSSSVLRKLCCFFLCPIHVGRARRDFTRRDSDSAGLHGSDKQQRHGITTGVTDRHRPVLRAGRSARCWRRRRPSWKPT